MGSLVRSIVRPVVGSIVRSIVRPIARPIVIVIVRPIVISGTPAAAVEEIEPGIGVDIIGRAGDITDRRASIAGGVGVPGWTAIIGLADCGPGY
jgi:hypothetical protein